MANLVNPLIDRYSNFKVIHEDDFNITPENIYIWRGEFPYKPGDVFPDAATKARANEYKTNQMLYKNKFNGIMDNIFSWADLQQNPITSMTSTAIIADLPDFNTTTESWVELIAAKHPRINSTVSNKEDKRYNDINTAINNISNILINSNFGTQYQDLIRGGYCMYGNKVVRISRLDNGNVNIIDMPLKCWIPWVNDDDTTAIEVNMFFSIFQHNGKMLCQFMCYYENGVIEKRTFEYHSGTLGPQIGEVESTKAFEGKDVSPIIVFTGDRIGGGIFGESQYKYWDASIAFTIRSFESIGILMEQMKEIYRVIPGKATKTDEDSGITYNQNTGTIYYEGEAPEVKLQKIQLQLDQAIEVYKTALKRVSKDTGLPLSYFDETSMGGKISADALRTSMFRSELKAEKIMSLFKNDLRRMIVRIGLAIGEDISPQDFDVVLRAGFINDKELQMKIIQARNGGAVTLSVADSIALYEESGVVQAMNKADELQGINSVVTNIQDVKDTTSGGESVVDGGLSFDNVSDIDDNDYNDEIIESQLGVL